MFLSLCLTGVCERLHLPLSILSSCRALCPSFTSLGVSVCVCLCLRVSVSPSVLFPDLSLCVSFFSVPFPFNSFLLGAAVYPPLCWGEGAVMRRGAPCREGAESTICTEQCRPLLVLREGLAVHQSRSWRVFCA